MTSWGPTGNLATVRPPGWWKARWTPTAGEMPDPPMVGNRILIAPRRAPIIADPAVFEPLVTGPEILYEAASGQLAVARGLAGLRELDAGLDFDQLRTEIRRLVTG